MEPGLPHIETDRLVLRPPQAEEFDAYPAKMAGALALRATLATVVPDLQRYCHDRWMLIGSAAARLAGAAVTVADIDVLTSEGDAARLLDAWTSHRDREHVPPDVSRFRSLFARFNFVPLPVEVMGGLELSGADRWESVTIEHTMLMDVGGADVPMPTLDEQIRLLESFGRPKDMTRAMALKSIRQKQP